MYTHHVQCSSDIYMYMYLLHIVHNCSYLMDDDFKIYTVQCIWHMLDHPLFISLFLVEPADIVDGNLKLTLGLLQQLANHYPLPQSDSKRGISPDALLLWFQVYIAIVHNYFYF